MLERADKKLVLEMVNRESKEEGDDNKNSDEDKARGLSASELLEDIRFGCEAIFGNSTNNELPSWEDIDNITDRSRKESDSIGKLQGGTSKTAQSFNAQKDFSATQHFGGANFRDIRTKLEEQEKKRTPKNLQGIAHLWKEIEALGNKKRAKKSRIVLLEGKGSGYGSATVPVLASNNYDLQNGESSVFDRELRQKNKANFEVKKRKKGAQHENQGHCQVRD